MKKLALFFTLFIFISFTFASAQQLKNLTKKEIIEDLDFLDRQLQTISSYQGLNGFYYKPAFDDYIRSLKEAGITHESFGLFLTKTIGLIGDRHSYVKEYDLPKKKYLPFIAAPLNGEVVGLIYNKAEKKYTLLNPQRPYLTFINDIPINDFLNSILPEEIKAPSDAYFTRAVKQLKYIEENYATMQKELPSAFEFTFSDGLGNDAAITTLLETNRRRYYTWIDQFYDGKEKEELNDSVYAKKQFYIDDHNIAYMRLSDMARPRHAPIYFDGLNNFMPEAKLSKALIIDIRSNDGGSRDLIFEMAKYIVHPDSVYVVNIAKQRGDIPLNDDYKGQLNRRSLFTINQLDKREQNAVHKFMATFKPMYEIPDDKFSEYYFTLFNGQKLKGDGYHYNKPIYILMNERCFSSASVFAAVFKSLPNVKLVGVTTDGSSGNSEEFLLPNSKLEVQLSTMVSFQKDGKILDGYGTQPDIEIKRDLNHIFWEEDFQLKKLKEIIHDTIDK